MDGNFKYKKSLGQNFLIDNNIILKIVSLCETLPRTLIIEIGPGSGALTQKLIDLDADIICYEIDENLKRYLNNINSDKLKINYENFLNAELSFIKKNNKYKHLIFISNLPYYITTAIINKIIFETNPDQMIMMVQKEVGDRFTAQPNSKNYNSLSIFLQYNFTVKKEFVVGKKCFFPSPNVDSMVINFKKRKKEYLKNEERFYKLVKDAFQFKRKTLKNNLKQYDLFKIEKILNATNKSLSSRAESLTIQEFVNISNELN